VVAYLVLSHVNAAQVVRLVTRLSSEPDTVVFLSHDGNSYPLPADAFAGFTNVYLVPRPGAVTWGTFSQIDAVLAGIEAALASGVAYDWMILLSGQDYPCGDIGAFHRDLAGARVDGILSRAPADNARLRSENIDRYYFRYRNVPPALRPLNARLWRLNRMQPFFRFQNTRIGARFGIADRRAFGRRTVYRGSFWWALSRACTIALAETPKTDPELVEAYRHRLHPDESFFQTVLMAQRQFTFANDELQYLKWHDAVSGSPEILRLADLPEILASRKPFARKFDTRVDAEVLDVLDNAIAHVADAPSVVRSQVALKAAPRLSIGMPVYNGEKFIAEAIESILNQTYTNFELIISDNASTDTTPEIVRAYAAVDDRIRFVRNDRNMGASFNYNRTFELAQGELFRPAAHDDTLAPACLERCIEALDADPSIVLAYTQSVCIDEHGQQLAEYKNIMPFMQDRPSDRFAAYLRRAFDTSPEANRGSNPACNPIFGVCRMEVLARTPMVANYIAADRVLLGELALHGKLFEVPQTLFFIRAHGRTSWAHNPSMLDVAEWFDPANRTRVISYMPHLRWLYEYQAAIARAPLSGEQRTQCLLLLAGWAVAHAGSFLREFASVGVRFLGLRNRNGASAPRVGPPRSC
jgi:glycosyltransferase involved in cell wall biosynthesis